jgi:hypothetical protein
MAEIVADLNLGNLSLSNVHVEAGPHVLASNVAINTSTHGDYSSRLIVIPQTSGTDGKYFSLENPTANGLTYRFVYGGTSAATAAQDITIQTSTADHTVKGVISHLSTDSGISSAVVDDNTANKVTVNTCSNMDLTFTSNSTTNWQVSGSVSSANAPAFVSSALIE